MRMEEDTGQIGEIVAAKVRRFLNGSNPNGIQVSQRSRMRIRMAGWRPVRVTEVKIQLQGLNENDGQKKQNTVDHLERILRDHDGDISVSGLIVVLEVVVQHEKEEEKG